MGERLNKTEILNIDCMDYMSGLEDNAFDLAIVDPPYGIGRSKSIGKRKNEMVYTKYEDKKWDKKTPTKHYFKELKRVSKNQIIWGANYFGIPFSKMIIWDKKIGDNDFSMAEIASHSFSSSTKIHSLFCGANRNGKNTTRIHPTQKPVRLYDWLLQNYAKPEMRIIDTHLGSGSSAIAAHYFGCDFVGCEIDRQYFEAAQKRFEKETRQLGLNYG
jgi:site-specific DNA-methyltransferase (adenine-specific)